MSDFESRCGYSGIHSTLAGGAGALDVDHFNPRPKKPRNRYDNLILASRMCNGKKSNHWPTNEQRRQFGVRFLNPTAEIDYGEHLFEDPRTHKIFGITRAGRYHVRMLGLNEPHLVKQREMRSKLRGLSQLNEDLGSVFISGTAQASLAATQHLADLLPPTWPQASELFPSDE